MKSSKLTLFLLAAVIFLSFSFVSASAQGFGTLVGTITDPSGSVIPKARVSITDEGTQTSRSAMANEQGYYVIPALRPSTYDLTASASGFAGYSQKGVTLLADQSLTVDVKMTIGQITETVSVQSNQIQVDTSTSTLSQVVEQKRITDLPLNGRNPVSLALLVPGTTQAPADNADQGQYKTIPVAITVSANGSRANQTGFNLDGSSNNDIYTNVNQPFPFPDALQEFSVQTANYSSRYGGNAGAIVNAISRSGTNTFHGDVFEFVRNAVFNGANHFGYQNGVKTRDQLKRNQFGGVIGGPVWRDKTFFFFGYQQTQIRNIANGNTAIVPTPAQLTGDFSGLCTTFTAGLCTTGTQLFHPNQPTVPYLNNQILASSFDPAAVKFATQYLPTSAAGTITYGLPLSQSFNEYIVRGDQVLGAKDHLFARYYLDKYNNNPFLTASNYLTTVSATQIYSHNAIIGETHVFSPNLLNDARLSFSRVTTNAGPPSNSISATDLGIPVYQPPQFAKALDGMNVSGYFNISSFPPSIMNRTAYTLSDDLSWTRGRHNFSFGGSIARGQVLLRDAYLYGGVFSFTADNTGNALSSFLLGSMRTLQQGAGEFKDNRDYYYTFYGQDDFHASHKLTLNLGLRYEPFIPWYEANGRVEQFRAANYAAGIVSTQFPLAPAGLLFPGDTGMPKYGVTASYLNFSPRVGFAYDVFGNGKTSVRAGFGIFFDSQQVGIENNRFVDVSPFSTQVAVTTPTGTLSNPYLGMTNPFPPPAKPLPSFVFPTPVLVVTYDPRANSRMEAPVTYNYNLTVEHQLQHGILGTIGYVGAQSRHQTETVELDPAIYIPAGSPGSTLSTDQRRAYNGLPLGTAPTGKTLYGSIGQGTQDLISNYNSLQVTAQRRMSQFTILANYTFSKALDDVPNGQGNAGVAAQSLSTLPSTNPLRHPFDYGRSDYDRAHIVSVSYVWDLPTFNSQNMLMRETAGGWQLTGIIRRQSGQGFTATAGSDRSQTGLNADRAMLLPGSSPYGGTACAAGSICTNYLNPKAFVTSYTATSFPLGTYGNTGKNAFNGPAYMDWDVGALKNFALMPEDRLRLQFHAEFFNVLNHTNFNNPTSAANSANFGKILGSQDPRIGQLALKLIF
jgi:Carboxypeptidase regulatory-like domain